MLAGLFAAARLPGHKAFVCSGRSAWLELSEEDAAKDGPFQRRTIPDDRVRLPGGVT
jgi:hypothetical protein